MLALVLPFTSKINRLSLQTQCLRMHLEVPSQSLTKQPKALRFSEWNIKQHTSRAHEWTTRDEGQPSLSPATFVGSSNMESLKDGLTCLISGAFGSSRGHCPDWHMGESDAIGNAGTRLLRPSCCQLVQATSRWSSGKPSGWCYSALPNLWTKQVRPPRLLTLLLYHAFTLSCCNVTAGTAVCFSWMLPNCFTSWYWTTVLPKCRCRNYKVKLLCSQ